MSVQVRSNSPENDAAAMKVSKVAGAGQAAPQEGTTADESDPVAQGEPQEEQEELEASESDPEAAEAEGETGEEGEAEPEEQSEGEEEQAATGKDEQKPKVKKKGGFQKRIEKLNARTQAEQAARLAAERERDYYREMLAKGGQKTETTSAPTIDTSAKPRAEDFKSEGEYLEALTDWKVDQRLKAKEADNAKASIQTEQQRMISAHAERINAFKAKTPDFDEVIADADPLVAMSPAMEQMIVTSELGPEVLYHLCKNPAEANRIAKLRPIDAAKEIGKIELRLAPKAPGSKEPEIKVTKVTKAPKPLGSIQSGGKAATSRTIFTAQDQKEYEAIRAQQIKERQASR